MRILDRAKSAVITYILPAIVVVIIQYVVGIFGGFTAIACGSISTTKCQITLTVLKLLFFGIPLAGAGIVFQMSKSWRKALLFLLLIAGFDILLWLYRQGFFFLLLPFKMGPNIVIY